VVIILAFLFEMRDASRSAAARNALKKQKPRLIQPRFLQQEKRRGKMKKIGKNLYQEPSGNFSDWKRLHLSVRFPSPVVWLYYTDKLLTKKVCKY